MPEVEVGTRLKDQSHHKLFLASASLHPAASVRQATSVWEGEVLIFVKSGINCETAD